MSLTPVNNGDSGSVARGKINTAFTQVDTNTSDMLTKQPLDGDLTAIASLNTNGLIARTGVATVTTRTITGTGNLITVTDGSGILGNPTISAGTDVVTLTGTQTLANKTLTSPALNTPTGLVKGDVGLGNVDNTSDATKNSAAVALSNKTSLNTHTIPGGSGTIALTTDIANSAMTKQDKDAVSTLFNRLTFALTDVTLGASDYNTFFVITNSSPTTLQIPVDAAIVGFNFGGTFEVYNSSISIDTVTLTPQGPTTIIYSGTLTNLIQPNECAKLIHVGTNTWLRIY